MIFYYKSKNKSYAQENRNQHTMTEAEWKFRNIVLKEDKTWYRFLRQKLVWNYILDFYCAKLRLCIEIDDNSHDQKYLYDLQRTQYLNTLWIHVIRYRNREIYRQLDSVIIDLSSKLEEREKYAHSLKKSFRICPKKSLP